MLEVQHVTVSNTVAEWEKIQPAFGVSGVGIKHGYQGVFFTCEKMTFTTNARLRKTVKGTVFIAMGDEKIARIEKDNTKEVGFLMQFYPRYSMWEINFPAISMQMQYKLVDRFGNTVTKSKVVFVPNDDTALQVRSRATEEARAFFLKRFDLTEF